MHYRRWSKTGDPGNAEAKTENAQDHMCQVNDCNRPWTSKKYCDKHYRRFRANGDPTVKRVGGKPKAFCTAKDCDRPAFGHGLTTCITSEPKDREVIRIKQTVPKKVRYLNCI